MQVDELSFRMDTLHLKRILTVVVRSEHAEQLQEKV